MNVKQKFALKNGDLRYLMTHPRIQVGIGVSDEEGVIWCSNCYKDGVPIFYANLDGVDIIELCEDCLRFFFQRWRELLEALG